MPEEKKQEEKAEKESKREESKKIENQEKGREEKLVKAEITEEMQKAYIDYAMSVIVSRALPAVEDGLKPVHRRILYTIYRLGLLHSKQTKKSATIVGNCMAKFHPHGDIAIYDALARMTQDFSLRYPLVYGQGNWGSIDGDAPAHMRYTEAKLSKISDELLQDIDKGTVEWQPNFDNSLKEPLTLPAKLPNLLLNGASGIAVGMTTNIPPHNLQDVCDAIIAYIENNQIKIEKLIKIIRGPDFPTGGYIIASQLEQLYKTGKASLTVRGKTVLEKAKKRERIVITEIPYMLNKSALIEEIANLVRAKKLPDIAELRDESAKGKIRIVIDLRKGADMRFTLNRLFQYTRLQDRFNAIMLALVGGKPQILNLKEIIACYVDYRKKVVTRKCRFELQKAEERQHIVQGLLLALGQLDKVIETIKKSKGITEASQTLQQKFKLSSKQAQAILEMRLQQLTALEHEKLRKEEKELKNKIKELTKILASEKEILNIIKHELQELKRKYADTRKTYILQKIAEIKEKDLIARKEVVVTITAKGYVKRIPFKTYHEQRRGGKGVIGAELATGDFVKQLITCSTHDYLLFFTNKGKVYWLKAYAIPEVARYGKGKAIINLLNIKDEIVTSVLPVKQFTDFLFMTTKKGVVKRVNLETFSRPRKTGVRAITLKDDELIDVEPIKGEEEVLLVTRGGQAIRFSSNEIRVMGRAAYGVRGIKLEDDVVVSLEILKEVGKEVGKEAGKEAEQVLTITENGYGKRTLIAQYRKTRRAGKGIINLKCTKKTGKVVKTVSVKQDDSIIVTTAKGMVIKVPAKQIRLAGRATQGVRIIRLSENDFVSDLVKVQKAEG